jgi:hypothetical protein
MTRNDDVADWVALYANQGVQLDDAEIARIRARSEQGKRLLGQHPVPNGSLWIETRARCRVFRVTAVNSLQVSATPAFPQPRWRREEAWGVDDFLRLHRPFIEEGC